MGTHGAGTDLHFGEQGPAALVTLLIHEIRIHLPSWRSTGETEGHQGSRSHSQYVLQPRNLRVDALSLSSCLSPLSAGQAGGCRAGWGLQDGVVPKWVGTGSQHQVSQAVY